MSERRRSRRWITAVVVALLSGWLCWAHWARISLYEVTSKVRIEADSGIYQIDSPVSGRIVQSRLEVGRQLHRGDMLVEIDDLPDQLHRDQEMRYRQSLSSELEQLRLQIAAEELARAEEQKSAQLNIRQADDQVGETEIAAKYSEHELARFRALHAQGVLPDRDLEKAEADAQKLRASVTALQSAASRIPQEQATRDRERDIRVRGLQEDLAKLKAEQETTKVGIDRFTYETEQHRIRTPVEGRVAEAEILRIGSVVHEGERLGSVLAPGGLIVVAEYPADAAFGRIRAGQAATLRLDGFPWEEFGTVTATVSKVAEEATHGEVRVELSVNHDSSFQGSLQHGMPGTLEILIDRQSPLALISRTGGQWLTARR